MSPDNHRDREHPGPEHPDGQEARLHSTVFDDDATVLRDGSTARRMPRPRTGELPRHLPVRLGSYVLEERVGRGAMGAVYRAHQEGLQRVVALKVLLEGLHATPSQRRRFHREAKAMARLRHPNIVSVHEVGEHEGQPFFTMDFIDGLPLDEFINATKITSPVVIAELCARIADAVAYAHRQGVVHRDLKPSNILVDRQGNPVITDFGLAKELDGGSLVSMSGDVLGTPAFMSPEQAAGHLSAVDERSDVYSLGAVLYALLAHREPFAGKTLVETLTHVIHHDPPPLHVVNPEVTGDLGAICSKAMEKEARDRYDSADAFAQDLRRFINGYPVLARPRSRGRAARLFFKRHRRELLAATGAALLVAGAALILPRLFTPGYLEQVAAELQDPDALVRADALTMLSRELVQPSLLKPARRSEALSLLLSAQDDAAVEPRTALLLFLARHGDRPFVRQALDADDIRWLTETAGDGENRDEQDLAFQAISGIRRPEMVEYLIAGLEDPNPVVRMRMIRALGTQHARAALAPLMRIVVTDPICRTEAEAALERVYQEGRFAVSDSTDQAVAASLRQLSDAVGAYQRRVEEALAPAQAKATPGPFAPYVDALQAPNAETRLAAIYELGRTGEAEAVPLLVSAFADEDPVVGAAAAMAAARLGGDAQREVFAFGLDAHAPAVRANSALALGFTRAPAALDHLLVALAHEGDPAVRAALVQALGESGLAEARPTLLHVLEEEPALAEAAQQALSRLPD